MRKIALILSLIAIPASLTAAPVGTSSSSASRQFFSQAMLGDGTPVSVTIASYGTDEQRADGAIASAIDRMRWLDHEIFAPDGIEAKINALPKGEAIKLPPDVFAMIEKAVQLSAQTSSWYDVAAPAPGNAFINRDWRRIILDAANQTLSFKSDRMKLDLRRIAHAYFVDMAMDELGRAGFENAMVEVGGINRNRGHDIFTPWNVQIRFGSSQDSYAYRVYNYNLSNIAVATVTPIDLGKDLIDGRNKKPVAANSMRSITIFAKDAATATAYALAVFTIGEKRGIKYVDRHPEIKGIMVDNAGNLISSAGLNLKGVQNTNNWSAPQTGDGGSNDLRQKKQEEDREM